MPLLITQSLLSAWQWVYKATEQTYEDADREAEAIGRAEADFMRTLRRERGEPSPAMLAGRDFEALCYAVADGTFRPRFSHNGAYEPNFGEVMGEPEFPPTYPGACQVADIIRGAAYQVKARQRVTIGGLDFLLYGILDALKAGVVYDIKFKSKSLGSYNLAGAYMDSPQHPMYFRIVPEATRFEYLVSDGRDLYVETYGREDTPSIEDTISDFLTYLERTGLTPLYMERWSAK